MMLEIFNNLFMSIAEQMGSTLEKTAYSVNIKERLDFSCAIFDPHGNLVANAPHMPVHLGSMSESIRTVIQENREQLAPGNVYVLNAPYNGGTHLPDLTVVTPVFDAESSEVRFFVASRGHHADIGGVTPGSMPPDSCRVDEEGVLIDNFKLVDGGRFREAAMRQLLTSGRYPARNPDQNIADLKAQIAANEKGVQEIGKMIEHYSLNVVHAYMKHVQDNAEEHVRRVLDVLKDGRFRYPLDDGAVVAVRIRIDKERRSALIDFSETSPQQPTNFNAPSAVCRAAVLYVFPGLVYPRDARQGARVIALELRGRRARARARPLLRVVDAEAIVVSSCVRSGKQSEKYRRGHLQRIGVETVAPVIVDSGVERLPRSPDRGTLLEVDSRVKFGL